MPTKDRPGELAVFAGVICTHSRACGCSSAQVGKVTRPTRLPSPSTQGPQGGLLLRWLGPALAQGSGRSSEGGVWRGTEPAPPPGRGLSILRSACLAVQGPTHSSCANSKAERSSTASSRRPRPASVPAPTASPDGHGLQQCRYHSCISVGPPLAGEAPARKHGAAGSDALQGQTRPRMEAGLGAA